MIDRWKNPNGTYNGVQALSDISGISQEEVRWTFDRLKILMQVEKIPKKDALKIVKEESKLKPWIGK